MEHSTLTTTNLHENKGVSTATDNTVATAVSSATVWAKLTASNLTGTGNSFGAQLLHVREEQASGTGTAAITTGAWRTRVLNTTKTNEIGATLGSNQITLLAGTYYIQASAPAVSTNGHMIKLRNITDASDTITGPSASNASANTERAFLNGRFTIAGTKVFELQHRVGASTGVNGQGIPNTFGVVETYAEVLIWKVL